MVHHYIHLGFKSYHDVALADLKNARVLSRAREASGYFTVLSDIHRLANPEAGALQKAVQTFRSTDVEDYQAGLPVVAFRFTDQFKTENPDIQQKWVQTLLRAKGWIVPNYELAPNLEHIEILRVVVKENFSEVLCDRLVSDIVEIVEQLLDSESPAHALSALGANAHRPNSHESKHGNLKDEAEGVSYNGAYSKPC
ncbi:unnamed protein product [Peniophora sp. CBMAI 1063]|nr:unnamed protein product [Peniophora sp. CBMAI 1063]